MITATEIQLFQILRQKLGEAEAEALVTFVDAKLKESNDQNLKVLATKEDIANLRTELKENIGNVRTEIATSKAEVIKWMFIFWVGSIAVISGIMFTMLNAYIKH
jgi:hypothetical protein